MVCGSQEGVLEIFSWNQFGDVTDRFPGHPNSVDALLKIDEDTLVTGSSDGLIRFAIGLHHLRTHSFDCIRSLLQLFAIVRVAFVVFIQIV